MNAFTKAVFAVVDEHKERLKRKHPVVTPFMKERVSPKEFRKRWATMSEEQRREMFGQSFEDTMSQLGGR